MDQARNLARIRAILVAFAALEWGLVYACFPAAAWSNCGIRAGEGRK